MLSIYEKYLFFIKDILNKTGEILTSAKLSVVGKSDFKGATGRFI